jgi:dTDP-4-dehydrorhamnose 3,5-epimerase
VTLALHPTPIAGVHEVESTARADARGHFVRAFCRETFAAQQLPFPVAQVNVSVTHARGTVRGLHLQVAPVAECKLVRCLRGRVFDVAVDLRAHSPTFGQWHAIELDEHVHRALLIPEGVAHGFQALTNDVQLLYLHSAPYASECERGLHHADPTLDIPWPLPVSLLSERDAGLPSLAEWSAV